MARWCRLGGNVDLLGDNLRPGIVKHFTRQNVQVNGGYLTCVLAVVRWFSEHPLSQNGSSNRNMVLKHV